jgi:hypothetical protein
MLFDMYIFSNIIFMLIEANLVKESLLIFTKLFNLNYIKSFFNDLRYAMILAAAVYLRASATT